MYVVLRIVAFLNLFSIFLSSKGRSPSSSTVIGLTTKDSVLISSNCGYLLNGVDMEQNFEWIYEIGSHIVIGLEGDPSDCEYLKSILDAFQRDHYLKFEKDISCSTLAYFCRHKIADALRSKQPFQVNAIVAGWDSIKKKPQLFWLDSIGSIQAVDYCTHGRYTPFILSVLDRRNTILSQPETSLSSSSAAISPNPNYDDITVSSEGVAEVTSHNIVDSLIHDINSNDNLLIKSHQRQVKNNHCHGIKYASSEYGLDTINDCWKELKKRSVSSLNKCVVKRIDKDGISSIDS